MSNKYKIIIARNSLKFINKQPPEHKRRILAAIYKLPDVGDIKKLEGVKGLMRLRVGDYRIIYSVNHGKLIVYVIGVDSRGEIYKRY